MGGAGGARVVVVQRVDSVLVRDGVPEGETPVPPGAPPPSAASFPRSQSETPGRPGTYHHVLLVRTLSRCCSRALACSTEPYVDLLVHGSQHVPLGDFGTLSGVVPGTAPLVMAWRCWGAECAPPPTPCARVAHLAPRPLTARPGRAARPMVTMISSARSPARIDVELRAGESKRTVSGSLLTARLTRRRRAALSHPPTQAPTRARVTRIPLAAVALMLAHEPALARGEYGYSEKGITAVAPGPRPSGAGSGCRHWLLGAGAHRRGGFPPRRGTTTQRRLANVPSPHELLSKAGRAPRGRVRVVGHGTCCRPAAYPSHAGTTTADTCVVLGNTDLYVEPVCSMHAGDDRLGDAPGGSRLVLRSSLSRWKNGGS